MAWRGEGATGRVAVAWRRFPLTSATGAATVSQPQCRDDPPPTPTQGAGLQICILFFLNFQSKREMKWLERPWRVACWRQEELLLPPDVTSLSLFSGFLPDFVSFYCCFFWFVYTSLSPSQEMCVYIFGWSSWPGGRDTCRIKTLVLFTSVSVTFIVLL